MRTYLQRANPVIKDDAVETITASDANRGIKSETTTKTVKTDQLKTVKQEKAFESDEIIEIKSDGESETLCKPTSYEEHQPHSSQVIYEARTVSTE